MRRLTARPGLPGSGRCQLRRRDGVGRVRRRGARPAARGPGNRRRLGPAGSKPWCSLAAQLDHAVLTAHMEAGGRAAFAVDLHAHGRGLRESRSGPAGDCAKFPAAPSTSRPFPPCRSAAPGWYYQRPGFAWGGMGVAACWLGGAVAVARSFADSLRQAADGGREPDQIALAHLGEIDRTLAALTAYLAGTAARIDAGELSGTRRVAGSPARARQRGRRRRTRPDAREPKSRSRPRSPLTSATENGWPISPCTSASTTRCATTRSWAP